MKRVIVLLAIIFASCGGNEPETLMTIKNVEISNPEALILAGETAVSATADGQLEDTTKCYFSKQETQFNEVLRCGPVVRRNQTGYYDTYKLEIVNEEYKVGERILTSQKLFAGETLSRPDGQTPIRFENLELKEEELITIPEEALANLNYIRYPQSEVVFSDSYALELLEWVAVTELKENLVTKKTKEGQEIIVLKYTTSSTTNIKLAIKEIDNLEDPGIPLPTEKDISTHALLLDQNKNYKVEITDGITTQALTLKEAKRTFPTPEALYANYKIHADSQQQRLLFEVPGEVKYGELPSEIRIEKVEFGYNIENIKAQNPENAIIFITLGYRGTTYIPNIGPKEVLLSAEGKTYQAQIIENTQTQGLQGTLWWEVPSSVRLLSLEVSPKNQTAVLTVNENENLVEKNKTLLFKNSKASFSIGIETIKASGQLED